MSDRKIRSVASCKIRARKLQAVAADSCFRESSNETTYIPYKQQFVNIC